MFVCASMAVSLRSSNRHVIAGPGGCAKPDFLRMMRRYFKFQEACAPRTQKANSAALIDLAIATSSTR
jgi:hypothetical protein